MAPPVHEPRLRRGGRPHAGRRPYRRFHAAPLLPLTKTVFDMNDEHDGRWPNSARRSRRITRGWGRQTRLRPRGLEASGLDLVPCFNDPMTGNFLLGEDGSILLIDFEYASNNDRLYDSRCGAARCSSPKRSTAP